MKTNENARSFVFLAHWVENWNFLLWWSKSLHRNPNRAWLWFPLWPICALMSVVYLIGRKAYDVVDKFHFSVQYGETWLVRNMGWHFLKESWRERIRQRIYRAVLDAQDRGFKVIGLGALTKAEWLTEGGEGIVSALGSRLTTPLVHGDTLTAATVVHQALDLMHRYDIRGGPVLLTGSTSKIGRAVALALASYGVRVRMYTKDRNRFEAIRAEAGTNATVLCQATSIKEGADCKLWITGKAEKGAGKRIIKTMPRGAVVLNFSVPDPLPRHLLRRRVDITHVDGGLLAYNHTTTSLQFTMRLTPGVTYACHAGTMVHAAMGWKHSEVGQVDMHAVNTVWEAALKCGFFLPKPTDHLVELRLPLRPDEVSNKVVRFPKLG